MLRRLTRNTYSLSMNKSNQVNILLLDDQGQSLVLRVSDLGENLLRASYSKKCSRRVARTCLDRHHRPSRKATKRLPPTTGYNELRKRRADDKIHGDRRTRPITEHNHDAVKHSPRHVGF
jgi:hypothetical protein